MQSKAIVAQAIFSGGQRGILAFPPLPLFLPLIITIPIIFSRLHSAFSLQVGSGRFHWIGGCRLLQVSATKLVLFPLCHDSSPQPLMSALPTVPTTYWY